MHSDTLCLYPGSFLEARQSERGAVVMLMLGLTVDSGRTTVLRHTGLSEVVLKWCAHPVLVLDKVICIAALMFDGIVW